MTPKALRAEIYRRSLWAFIQAAWEHLEEPEALVPAPYMPVLCNVLEKITRREIRLCVINIPPGFLKTLFTQVFWPAWVWIQDPKHRWIDVSFDPDLTSGAGKKLIKLLESRWYLEHFGPRLKPGMRGVKMFETSAGGFRFNTSIGGTGTGRHAHTLVIDDPIKPKNAAGGWEISGKVLETTWGTIKNTFMSRRVDPQRFCALIMMQRVHEIDPAGMAIADGWHSVCFPLYFDPTCADPLDPRTVDGESLAPLRMPESMRESLILDMGQATFDTQYQQQPGSKEGGIFSESILRDCAVPASALAHIIGPQVQSWDLTFKGAEESDNVAGQPWRVAWPDGDDEPGHFYLSTPHPDFERLTFVETMARMVRRNVDWECSQIFVEDKANGPAVESVLQQKLQGKISLVNPQGSKRARAHSVSPLVASRRVHLVYNDGPNATSEDAKRFEAMVRNISRFPRVRYDDDTDAMTQALRELRGVAELHAAMSRVRGSGLGNVSPLAALWRR